ncbi:ATP-binding protein [Altericista sp. CCNU0014]|uniref:ATP-binding protein n=1 Tax=Altericista sp. CCNU0014 TaxID=3082949 RepID=UPI00384BA836
MPSLFESTHPIGRQFELDAICQTFAADGDLMLTGVTGSGRRTLIRHAARHIGARVLELDCLRATTSDRFLKLLAEGLLDLFSEPQELQWIEQWSQRSRHVSFQRAVHRGVLTWAATGQAAWTVFKELLTLPQVLAEQLDCRIVFLFENFPHIRAWDRSNQWEAYLREEIQRQSRVSYAVVATIPEAWAQNSSLKVMTLPPLPQQTLEDWAIGVMASQGLKFGADALALFLSYVQGHVGDASNLIRRIWVDYQAAAYTQVETQRLHSQEAPSFNPARSVVELDRVHHSTQALIDDLTTTFESLLLLLPPIQARVLESLAIDPTDSPHAREYVQKHQLSKGGGLQGALASLEQKGLIYGPKEGYAIALPLFRLWLKNRLS